MLVWLDGQTKVVVTMTTRETALLLDTIHIKDFFRYLVKILLNFSSVKTERSSEKYLNNKMFTIMFFIKFVLF